MARSGKPEKWRDVAVRAARRNAPWLDPEAPPKGAAVAEALAGTAERIRQSQED